MKNLKLILLFSIMCNYYLNAQSFQKRIGSTTIDPLILSNGDIGIALGDSYSLFDSLGNEKWTTSFNDQYTIYSAQESIDKSILLAGSNFNIDNVSSPVFIIVKKDSNGVTSWSSAFADTSFDVWYIEGSFSLQDGIVFYGRVSTHTPMQYRLAIVCRIDSTGNLLWGRLMNFGFGYPMRGILTEESEMVFVGDNLIFKMDENGNILWAKSSNDRLISIRQSPFGFYSILYEPNNLGIGIVNTDTSGNFLSGKIYQSPYSVPSEDLTYLSDSTTVIFGSNMMNPLPICEYLFFHIDKFQNPIYASHFGISIHCNTPFKITDANQGFVATGCEPFDDEGHLIKVANPYQIDCADTFQFTVDTASIAFSNISISSSNAFSQVSFTDSSNMVFVQEINYCGVTGLSMIKNPEIQLFPNPFSRDFILKLNTLDNSSVVIYDIYGREISIQKKVVGNEFHFNFQNEPDGIYFVTISNNFFKTVKKIIKTH